MGRQRLVFKFKLEPVVLLAATISATRRAKTTLEPLLAWNDGKAALMARTHGPSE